MDSLTVMMTTISTSTSTSTKDFLESQKPTYLHNLCLLLHAFECKVPTIDLQHFIFTKDIYARFNEKEVSITAQTLKNYLWGELGMNFSWGDVLMETDGYLMELARIWKRKGYRGGWWIIWYVGSAYNPHLMTVRLTQIFPFRECIAERDSEEAWSDLVDEMDVDME